MLDLLHPYEAARDGRGVQHVVDFSRPVGPPWTALCGWQLPVERFAFRSRLKDDAPRCRTCEHTYRDAVNPPPPKTSRVAPPTLPNASHFDRWPR